MAEAWREDPHAILRAQARAARPLEQLSADGLSRRELEVLRLLSAPAPLREIAAELFVSPNTLKSHCRSLYRKLGASSREQTV